MAKQGVKEQPKPKSLKDQKKELESKLFGEKNNAKKKEIQGMIKKIDMAMKAETDARLALEKSKKQQLVKQLIPVGVDPKTVQCVNFLNGNCDKGDDCQFGHDIKKAARSDAAAEPEAKRPKAVCRFLIDAINNGEHTANWVCPFPNCTDIHKLIELGENTDVEVSLEEYIELQRQTLDETNLIPVTEESFRTWRAQKDKEEELHLKRVSALNANVRGVDLFKLRPELFVDEDAEAAGADDVDYKKRNYEDFDEVEVENGAED
ncbi:hypothetical protein PAPHI01_0920 [Pancytospora philotis]|nr:hypothetical protein PAPHI01_0920 [Pancytospora philotis]